MEENSYEKTSETPPSMEQFMEQYKAKIKQQFDPSSEINTDEKVISKEYVEFKEQYMPPSFNFYEKGCNLAERIIKINPSKAKTEELTQSIDICHLNVTPAGITTFSILFPIVFIVVSSILSMILTRVFLGEASMFFAFFFFMAGVIMIMPLGNFPIIYANSWRLKASNQMVLCIFYIVSYMRHTSNLELALKFTTDHISPPLSLDMKKVLWNVETEKYESVKESLEEYLRTWRRWNMEFIEAMHLIEASLYEASEDRRLQSLDKALSVILDETYEKMLHFAHNLKSPLTMLHMLGIILPILGLVILPLVVSFMNSVNWYHIMILYNIALPISVFYLGKVILSRRPTGYGKMDITESQPELKKYQNILLNIGGKEIQFSPLIISLLVAGLFIFIGLLPVIIHKLDPSDYKNGETFDFVLDSEMHFGRVYSFDESKGAMFRFLGYKWNQDRNKIIGPFGLGSTLISLFVTLGAGMGVALYYHFKTRTLINLRSQAKDLEEEFASALFQLGNRIGDGLPAEIAFTKVAEVMQDTISGNFFQLVAYNISKQGMGVQRAIFDEKMGALAQYPSNLIESSMKVFIESARKGPRIASQALINISLYIKEMHKVDERLKDLMAEIVSDMSSQIRFLTPAISGIVVGITAMITTILSKLGERMGEIGSASGGDAGSMGAIANLPQLFGDSIPTFYFQIIVGLYVVQIIFILTMLVNAIQNGVDPLMEKYLISRNLFKSIFLYLIIAFSVTLLFNIIAANVIGSGIL